MASGTCNLTVSNPPPGVITYFDADFENGSYGGLSAQAGTGSTISIVGTDGGVVPYSGSHMVKFFHPTGTPTGSSWSQLRYLFNTNPVRTPEGIYFRWRLWVPVATMTNANSTLLNTDAQIKLHLFRCVPQPPDSYVPPAYHGLVYGVGRTFGSQFAIGKDHLNIWLANALNAVDDQGSWNKFPRYTGGAWLEIQEWYQSSDGLSTQYKLWLNNLLCKHEQFTPNTGGTACVGGPTTAKYEFRIGMPYLVNRSSGPYIVYVDKVQCKNAFITG